jgi:enterochelin esterase-like enzyme
MARLPGIVLDGLLCSLIVSGQTSVLGPDSQRQPNVPRGSVTKHTWTSKVFPGTVRDYWVYVPAQYDATRPAALIVFQAGTGFASETGSWRAPVVLDNLIHKGEMPVTIGIFVDPGAGAVRRAAGAVQPQLRVRRAR